MPLRAMRSGGADSPKVPGHASFRHDEAELLQVAVDFWAPQSGFPSAGAGSDRGLHHSLPPRGSARIAWPTPDSDFPTREHLCHSLVRQEHQESGAMRLVWLHQELGNGWAEGVHADDLDRYFAAYVVLSPNPPAVSLHDRPADRESHLQTFRLGAKNGSNTWARSPSAIPFPESSSITAQVCDKSAFRRKHPSQRPEHRAPFGSANVPESQ